MAITKLLLDFDGVVLKNDYLKRYQYDRSAMFVSKHTKKTYKESKKFNADMFPRYGHTVNMLQKLSKAKVTLQDYNDYLFEIDKLRWLKKFITPDTYKHGNDFTKVLTYYEEFGIDWYIFTNAHINWVMYFSKELDIPMPKEKIIWPQSTSYLKPSKLAYDYIEAIFPDSNFIFVDDTEKNLYLPMQRARWHPVTFRNDHTAKNVSDIIDLYQN